MRYKCPKCGKSRGLDIAATVNVRLFQYRNGEFSTDADECLDLSHEWDENSPMHCTNCGLTGKVDDFDTEKEEHDEPRTQSTGTTHHQPL